MSIMIGWNCRSYWCWEIVADSRSVSNHWAVQWTDHYRWRGHRSDWPARPAPAVDNYPTGRLLQWDQHGFSLFTYLVCF